MKEEHVKFYKTFKFLLGWLYKFWYNPKIIGKENIPQEEGVILCGNHIHVMDQCSIIYINDRMVHYMAKKEYFDGAFSWFFKYGGCIAVDRSIKDEDSKNKALELLNKGFTLGIFPEGTRNIVSCKKEKLDNLYKFYSNKYSYSKFKKILKDNQVKVSQIEYMVELKNNNKITTKEYIDNIINPNDFLLLLLNANRISKNDYYNSIFLPLKYGSVSLASKTNSYIVPFVTKGEYKFRSNNLFISIGKPFKIGNMSLDEANKKLRKEMIKLYSKL